jgi:hypothetical protein
MIVQVMVISGRKYQQKLASAVINSGKCLALPNQLAHQAILYTQFRGGVVLLSRILHAPISTAKRVILRKFRMGIVVKSVYVMNVLPNQFVNLVKNCAHIKASVVRSTLVNAKNVLTSQLPVLKMVTNGIQYLGSVARISLKCNALLLNHQPTAQLAIIYSRRMMGHVVKNTIAYVMPQVALENMTAQAMDINGKD